MKGLVVEPDLRTDIHVLEALRILQVDRQQACEFIFRTELNTEVYRVCLSWLVSPTQLLPADTDEVGYGLLPFGIHPVLTVYRVPQVGATEN